MKLGTALHYALLPVVWVIFALTLGKVDFRACAECKRRAAKLDKLLGNR